MIFGGGGAAVAQQAQHRILVLGDSLSAAHNIPVDQGWVELFSTNIGAEFPHTSVINASISGETTFGGLQRLPALLDEHRPSHLIIELGGNDGLRGLGFTQSTDNLRQMVRLAEQQSVAVLLVGVRMPPNLGAAYEGVAASDPDLMQQDGIHPTAKAQPILARKVTTKMIEILGR